MDVLKIINEQSYYFLEVESLCAQIRLTDHLDAQKALMRAHLKPGAHLMSKDAKEYPILEALLQIQTPGADLQLEHLSAPQTVHQAIRSSFFSLLDIQPCLASDEHLLPAQRSDSETTSLTASKIPPKERASFIFQQLPEVVLDLLNPNKTDLIEVIDTHFSEFNIATLTDYCHLISTSRTDLITQCLSLPSTAIDDKYQILSSALPVFVSPLLMTARSPFKTHTFLKNHSEKIDIPKLAKTLRVSSPHATYLDVIRLKLDTKPPHEIKGILLQHLRTDQSITPDMVDLLMGVHASLYNSTTLWDKYKHHKDLNVSAIFMSLEEKYATFNGTHFSQIPFSELQRQLAQYIDDVLPDTSEAIGLLSQIPTAIFSHQKLVIRNIASYFHPFNQDARLPKHRLIQYLKSPIDPAFLQSIIPQPTLLTKEAYLLQYQTLCQKIYPELDAAAISTTLLSHSASDVKSHLSDYLSTQPEYMRAIDRLDLTDLANDPMTFKHILNLAKLDDTLFLKVYFRLYKQYQKTMSFLEESTDDLLIGQSQIQPFIASTFESLTHVSSTKEYFENIEGLLQVIDKKYSQADATLIFTRLLSSAHIRSTSGFSFNWGFLEFKHLFKHQPWLHETPNDIIALMNMIHADFSFIEAHNAVQGCRFFVPDIANNEIRRQQVNALLQFQIQLSLFKRIHDQPLLASTNRQVMQFFTVACSKTTHNRFHQAYKSHAMTLLFEHGSDKIKLFSQNVFPQWIEQLQSLINHQTDLSKKELLTILNSILLTPHFIFEKVIHELRTQSPGLEINEPFLVMCANLNHTVKSFDHSAFYAFQGNIHEKHLCMVSLYLQYTQHLPYAEAQKLALSLPQAITQVILAHCNFSFRAFLNQCMTAIKNSSSPHTVIAFDMDLSAPGVIDLSPLQITGQHRHHSSHLIKLIEHIDQYPMEHSPQQTNAIRDAIIQTKAHTGWRGPLRQAQINFENGQETPVGVFRQIKDFFLNFVYRWSTGYQNAREAYHIAADQEYLRSELLRAQFIQDFQTTHPTQSISNCQRAMHIQEKAGILPSIKPLY